MQCKKEDKDVCWKMWGLQGNWILCLLWKYLFVFTAVCSTFAWYPMTMHKTIIIQFPFLLVYVALIMKKSLRISFISSYYAHLNSHLAFSSEQLIKVCIFIQMINTKGGGNRLLLRVQIEPVPVLKKLCGVFPFKHFFSTCSRVK